MTTMHGVCKFCGDDFIDHSKNHNREICDKKECLRKRSRIYKSRVSKERKQQNMTNFFKKHPEYTKDRRLANIELCREQAREYIRERLKNNINVRLAHNIRSRLYKCVKRGISSSELLGCTTQQLIEYLESKFQKGMSWYNYSHKGWHIDHIKPLAKFDLTDPQQLKEACHYTNLQPLWAKDNFAKGDSYKE